MRYIWIWILVIIDVIWLISSIKDVIVNIKWGKEHKWHIKFYDIYGGNIIKSIIHNLDYSTIVFALLHLGALFVVSFGVWLGSLK